VPLLASLAIRLQNIAGKDKTIVADASNDNISLIIAKSPAISKRAWTKAETVTPPNTKLPSYSMMPAFVQVLLRSEGRVELKQAYYVCTCRSATPAKASSSI